MGYRWNEGHNDMEAAWGEGEDFVFKVSRTHVSKLIQCEGHISAWSTTVIQHPTEPWSFTLVTTPFSLQSKELGGGVPVE